MTVDVTVPTLETVVLSGSGVVAVEGVTAERLVVRAPGSGVLTISGTAEQLDVSLTGSGDLRLEDSSRATSRRRCPDPGGSRFMPSTHSRRPCPGPV